jgi:hypothetical protein
VAEHELVRNSAVDNALNRLVKLHPPFHFVGVEGNGLPFAAVLPRLTAYQLKAASQPGLACEVIDQGNVCMHGRLKPAALVSAQTHLQKVGSCGNRSVLNFRM